jgi:hypothetical protein
MESISAKAICRHQLVSGVISTNAKSPQRAAPAREHLISSAEVLARMRCAPYASPGGPLALSRTVLFLTEACTSKHYRWSFRYAWPPSFGKSRPMRHRLERPRTQSRSGEPFRWPTRKQHRPTQTLFGSPQTDAEPRLDRLQLTELTGDG